ncbi:MAG TPA: MFS transporter [Solirubrobacteraceae bacterium]|nr:MFS transporter [Solirubrobacteraceae bacterium]
MTRRRWPFWALLLAVVLLGVNLRMTIASLPPLLPEIRRDLGLSATVGGLLTTVPVLCFGLLALVGPRMARARAIEWLLVGCMATVAVAAALRGVDGVLTVFAGSLFIGIAIGLGQTLLPILLRSAHAPRTGALTAGFSMSLTLGGTIAGGVAVPLAHLFSGSWHASLAFWALPALLALVVWVARARISTSRLEAPAPQPLRGEPLAWRVAAYFGCQSIGFYAGLAWLPTILQSHGYSAASAGWLQALASLVSALPALLVPLVATRVAHQRGLLAAVVSMAAAGVIGLLSDPSVAPLWMVMIGLGQGGALGLGLILPVLRGREPHHVASLTAMSFSLGYVIAAAGPWLLAAVHDLTGGWSAALGALLGLTLLQLVPGIGATAPRVVGAPSAKAGVP